MAWRAGGRRGVTGRSPHGAPAGRREGPAPPEATVDAALAASRRGWSVIPVHTVRGGRCSCGDRACPAPGKHPRIRWEEHQRRAAGEDEIRRWWGRWPDANLGLVTGTVSGLVVVDVDPRHGGDDALAELEARHGELPSTPEVLTGGGGVHLYLRHPGRPVPSGPIAPGVDVKADGGIAVAPPSLHVSGARYEWEVAAHPDAVPMADVPAWLLDLVDGAREPGGAVRDPGPRTPREQREFADLWAVLGVEVEPGDRSYLCPLHDDHHPSLHIDAEGCRWFCFGCGRGGGAGRLRRIVRSGLVEARPSGTARTARPESGLTPPPESATWLRRPALRPGGRQEVVGESRHQDALERVSGGRTWRGPASPLVTAELRPEPGNPVDPDAVRVDVGGLTVGYLPRGDGTRFRPVLRDLAATGRTATVRARVTGGWDRGPDGLGRFGIELDVHPDLLLSGPADPFLPGGRTVAVVGEEEHQAALSDLLGGEGEVEVVASLEDGASGRGELVVRVGGEPVGELGPGAAERYRPLVRQVAAAGLPATCRARVARGAREVEVHLALPRVEDLARG